MTQSIKKYGFLVILALLLAGMGTYLIITYTNIGNAKVSYTMNKPAPAFELEDVHLNETISLEGTNGTVRLIYFYFSHCPDVCPPSTYSLSVVQERLKEDQIFGEEARLISITFDPERDTPERLHEFAGSFQADPAGWHFLRGEVDEVRQVASDYNISVIDMGNGNFAHANFYFLVDKEGNIREYIGATDPDIDEIVKKIKGLL